MHLVTDPEAMGDLVDRAYDLQVRLITERGATHPIDDMWGTQLEGVVSDINSERSDTVAFVSGDKVITRQFTSDELDEFGLEDGIELDTELNFGGESVLEVPYKGIKIIFNKADNTIKLFKEPVEPPVVEPSATEGGGINAVDLSQIELTNPDLMNFFNSIGISETINDLISNWDFEYIEDMVGSKAAIKELEAI